MWKKEHNEKDAAIASSTHDPSGEKLERRALQVGLRGPILVRYAREWILDIQDISAFVQEHYEPVREGTYAQLVIPRERAYPVEDRLAIKLGMV